MSAFAIADLQYRAVIEAPGRALGAALDAARLVNIDLDATDITTAVLLRLKSFWLAQQLTKQELNKVYAAPASDFLVETVSFYLKIVLEKFAPTHTIASEKNIINERGSMRPDISIWKDNKVVAAIECKTQLGWNRYGWLDDFISRETRLKTQSNDAKLFLLVMTSSNWAGFGMDQRIGTQFFVLLNAIWPDKYDPTVPSHSQIFNPIEKLFHEVVTHVNGQSPSQCDGSPNAFTR